MDAVPCRTRIQQSKLCLRSLLRHSFLFHRLDGGWIDRRKLLGRKILLLVEKLLHVHFISLKLWLRNVLHVLRHVHVHHGKVVIHVSWELLRRHVAIILHVHIHGKVVESSLLRRKALCHHIIILLLHHVHWYHVVRIIPLRQREDSWIHHPAHCRGWEHAIHVRIGRVFLLFVFLMFACLDMVPLAFNHGCCCQSCSSGGMGSSTTCHRSSRSTNHIAMNDSVPHVQYFGWTVPNKIFVIVSSEFSSAGYAREGPSFETTGKAVRSN